MAGTADLIIWKGSSSIQLSPESPELINSKDGLSTVLVYHGTYAALEADQPARLSGVSGYSGYVDVVNLKRAAGGRGVMTVTLVPSAWSLTDGTPTIEVEWVEIQKKLETHPRYQPGGESALDDADLDQLDKWRNAPSSTARASEYATIAASFPELKNLVDKLRRGQDSYMVFAPVIRRITGNAEAPTTNRCGVITTPPIEITGYSFLQTADRSARKNGRWDRNEEWTGAEVWDTDIYGT